VAVGPRVLEAVGAREGIVFLKASFDRPAAESGTPSISTPIVRKATARW
jgi:hypothetical protein